MTVVFRTVLFVIFVHGTLVGLLPFLILFFGNEMFVYSGGMAGIAGLPLLGVGLWAYGICVRDFVTIGKGTPAIWDSPVHFIDKGLYRYVRNPMYLAILLILAAEALFFGSGLLWVYAVVVGVSFHLFVVLHEEPALKKKFGETYEEYRRTVRRWVPAPNHVHAERAGG